MKKTFKITLDTEFTIDFSDWELTDAQQKDEYASMKLLIDHYMKRCGYDEFVISEKDSGTLFETMAEVVNAQIYCALSLRDVFNFS